MTKAEIIEAVYENVGGFSKKDASEIVEMIFEEMRASILAAVNDKTEENVAKEGPTKVAVKISGFGNFIVRRKKERLGRNPRTGTAMSIEARHVLTFKPSQVLKNILNSKG